jgi:hypothetical protein
MGLHNKRFEVFHKGRRYWAHLLPAQYHYKWVFWSDHKWPMYHGSFKQSMAEFDIDVAHDAFIKWLPFKC